MKTEKITPRQFMIFVIFFIFGTIVVAGPSNLVLEAKQDSWISILMGTGTGCVLVGIYYMLAQRYPAMTIVEVSERVVGKWAGKIVGVLYAIVMFQVASGMLFYNAVFITTTISPDTPFYALVLTALIVVIYMMRLGMEVVARAAEVFFPFVMLLLVILYLGISPQIRMENLQPVFESGIRTLLRSWIRYSEDNVFPLVCMMMIIPSHLNDAKKGYKFFLIGVLAAGAIMLITTVLCTAVLGVDLTALYQYPTFMLAKKISIGNFFERVEVIIAIIWIVTILFKSFFLFYSAVQAYTQIFGLPNYRTLTIPFGTIVIMISLITHPNPQYVKDFIIYSWMPAIITVSLIVPLLLLIVSQFKRSDWH